APFSPTMPWMVPRRTASDTARLAWTAPKRLSMPTSSIAGASAAGAFIAPAPRETPASLHRAGIAGAVVDHLELAGDDVGARGVDRLLHVGRHQLAVVGIDRHADAVLLEAEIEHAGLPRPGLGLLEGVV